MSQRPWPEIAEELERRFSTGVSTPWSEEDFGALALEVFRLQFDSIPVYRAFCEARGVTPATVSTWEEVPAVPATALKHLDLCVDEPEIVFRTSGTTRGSERRGRHLVARPSMYRASLLPPFRAHVMYGLDRARFVSLIPSPDEVPDSSLSFMVGAASEAFATGTEWLIDAQGRLEEAHVRAVIAEAAREGEPVLLLGTALALLHAVELLEASRPPVLAEGSRVMETGGFKGFDRAIDRSELYDRIAASTGIPRTRIVSEYGMTELLSQLYEPVLSEGLEASGTHVPPPWLKVRTLDPTTLEQVGPGEHGLLCFFDLANAGSVCHILTEDVGFVSEGRVHLKGRAQGSEPRGCSRAMDELMNAAGVVR